MKARQGPLACLIVEYGHDLEELVGDRRLHGCRASELVGLAACFPGVGARTVAFLADLRATLGFAPPAAMSVADLVAMARQLQEIAALPTMCEGAPS
jgi:hypothetical protein